MKLYLMRHGDAVLPTINPSRPLSNLGRKQVQRLAEFIKSYSLQVDYIFHSGILRAQQTAEILAGAVHVNYSLEKMPGLEPNDAVAPIALELNAYQRDIILVAHLPFLGKLVSELILANSNYYLVNFAVSTLVCLEKIDGHWCIDWMLSPDLFV